MATWREFAEGEPAIATLAERTFRRYGIAYLATVDSASWPRLHPISPAIVDGQMYLGIIPTSPKRRDLDGNGRFMLHCLPGPDNTEVRLRGTVRRLPEPDVAVLVAKSTPKTALHRDTLYYVLDITSAGMTTYTAQPGETRPSPAHLTWRDPNGRTAD